MRTGPAHHRGAAVARRVIEVTLTLLGERGYHGFTVDDVAAAAGVHKTTVYRRWDTKPGLVAAAVGRLADEAVPVPSSGDRLADLEELAVSVARALRSPAGANALRAALTSAAGEPELRSTAARFLASRYAAATALLRAAQDVGEIRADADPLVIWQAIVNPLHLNALVDGSLSDATARSLVAVVLHGAVPPGPAAPRHADR